MKGEGLHGLHTGLCSENDRANIECKRENDSIDNESLDSISTAPTQPPWKGSLVKVLADHLQDGLKNP
jgi:hypothetical protein